MIVQHVAMRDLQAGLDHIRQSPQVEGRLELIVRRPQVGVREVLTEGQLDLVEGLVGDRWFTPGSTAASQAGQDPDTQLNVMNARVIALLAPDQSCWPLAGDQLYVDLDLSGLNLPVGTRVAIGSAVIEVTSPPHTGCHKFVKRFGLEAMKFVNSPLGRELNLRGINAKVVRAGTVRLGDPVRKL